MKKIDSVYLERLEYDKNLEKWFFAFFLARFRFLFLVIVIIAIAWILSLRALPLESTPEVNIWIWLVSVILPWASPETMEDLVTKRLEKEISKIKDVDTITSSSSNSSSMITVQFKSSANISDVMRELKDKVDLVKSKFPSDTKEPFVKELSFSDTPIWTFAISWDYSSKELYKYGKKIQDELEKNPLISEVTISWWEDSEFVVKIDPKKLENFWLSLAQVNSALQAYNITFPIWEYDVWNFTHFINIDERYYDTSKLSNIVVANLWANWIIYLKDLWSVLEVWKKQTTISRLSDKWSEPKNAVTIWIVKKRWGSIVNLIDEWSKTLENLKSTWILPSNLNVTTVVDQSERIKLDLNHLIRDWIITVLLVFFILFLIIWVKEALVAWVSAPLVFLITFSVMNLEWQTFNFLSMFALILSLWLLVDDAIVVISAINQYKRTEKFTTYESALLVLRDYRKVLVSTTLTVVWIFSAMMFMTWVIWKFIFSIPFIITITLLSSLVVALTINPALAVFFDRKKDLSKSHEEWVLDKWFISIEPLKNFYEKILRKFIWNRKWSEKFLIFTLLLFISSLLLPIIWILKSDFFPKTDQDIIYINIEADPGTKLSVTSDLAKKVEQIIKKEKEVSNFTVNIWWLASVWNSAWWSQSSPNYASITINLIKKEYWRKESSVSIAERLRNSFKNISEEKVTVIEMAWWPPTWSDFELKIAWENFDKLDSISKKVKSTLATIPWVINIQTSRKPLPLEFKLDFDSSKLQLYSLTLPQVAVFIKNSIDWIEATKIYMWTDEISVKTKYDENYTNTLDKIKDLKLKNNLGQFVYLRDLISIDLKKSVFSIQRVDQKRVVTISASADKSTTWKQIKASFDEKIKSYKLPNGYEFITGWANEENDKSVKSLLYSMIFWLMLCIWTLVILFDSYKQSVLVLVTIPLSLIWVFYWLTLFWQPLSFPWLIWLVALFWIVIRNWIILFDKINQNIAEWIDFIESIVDAWKTRLEPVFLTSVCTVLWMIPLTLSNPTWTSLWLSIIFGLSVSTIFTLVVLPTMYFMFVKREKK